MRSAEVITGTYYPLESTAHISHIAQGEKSHTDYTDFHRISSPTTNYARKRADCTEPDDKKQEHSPYNLRDSSLQRAQKWKKNQRKSAESARDDWLKDKS